MADTLDVLTRIEGYEAINDPASAAAGTGDNDDQMARFITAVSNRMDELVGPIVNRTVTEYHNGGVTTIWPRQTPVSSVTTLKEWDGSTVTTLTEDDTWGTAGNADGFRVQQSDSYSHDAKIIRRSSDVTANFASGVDAVELVYVAGRAGATASVPARYKMAAGAVLRRLWDREAAAWTRSVDPFDADVQSSSRFFNAVDHVVRELLGDELKPPGFA